MDTSKNGSASGISRRRFLAYGGAAGAVAAAAGGGTAANTAEAGWREVMSEVLKYRKIDSHNHVYMDTWLCDPARLVDSADRLGIERMAVSVPLGTTPADIRESNNKVLKAMKEYPDRFFGQCYINPAFRDEALEEIDRCIGEGMVQLGELYTLYKINDPVYYPIIERCIDLKIPALMHARADLGITRKGHPFDGPLSSSIPDDFVDIGKRYPEAMIIYAHIGGGGDWEYMCKMLKDSPGIYIDTSGSVTDEGMVDFALKYLGEDRMLFGTDLNFETGVGKIIAANLTGRLRRKIFFENYNNLLKKAGNHVD